MKKNSSGSDGENRGSIPPLVSSASSLDTFYAAAFPNGTNDLLDLPQQLLNTTTSSSDSNAATHPGAPNATSSSSEQEAPIQRLPTRETPLLHTPSGNIVSLPAGAAPVSGGSIPEFLYQLTKILTDNNRDIIEWTNGK